MRRAFSLLECLLALAIFAIGFMCIFALFSTALLLQKRTIDAVDSQHVARNAKAMLTACGIDQAGLLAWVPAADTDGLLHAGPSACGWSLRDRGYPHRPHLAGSLHAGDDRFPFYWVPMVLDADQQPGRYDWRTYVFIMRRGEGRTYDKSVGVWANPLDPLGVPGVREVLLDPVAPCGLSKYNFANNPRLVRTGDWIVDSRGNVSRAVDVTDTGASVDALILPSVPPDWPTSIWIGCPSDSGGPSPVKRVQLIVGVVR